MVKRNETTDLYTFDNLLKYECSYSWAIGQRSNGKTFDGKKKCIDITSLNKSKFVILKRRHAQITRSKMMTFFEDLETISRYGTNNYGDYIKYSTERGFYVINDGIEKTVGYAVAIEDMFLNKGVVYDNVDVILFDEVIEGGNYLQDEITLFLNTISTIVRNRQNVKILMTANTVARDCPYFDLFGIDISKLKKGSISTIYNDSGVSIAIEYCKTYVDLTRGKKHKYLGFDENLTSNMILRGDWEYRETNISNVDGIGWNCKNRYKIYAYVTYIGVCYEMTFLLNDNPIAFVRDINIQNGKVKDNIKYNFSADNSIVLVNKNGIVPRYNKIVDFIDDETVERINLIKKCVQSGRIVFNTVKTGTEFLIAFEKII